MKIGALKSIIRYVECESWPKSLIVALLLTLILELFFALRIRSWVISGLRKFCLESGEPRCDMFCSDEVAFFPIFFILSWTV